MDNQSQQAKLKTLEVKLKNELEEKEELLK